MNLVHVQDRRIIAISLRQESGAVWSPLAFATKMLIFNT